MFQKKKSPFGRIIPPFFLRKCRIWPFLNYLHDSNSIFWAQGINSEWGFGRTSTPQHTQHTMQHTHHTRHTAAHTAHIAHTTHTHTPHTPLTQCEVCSVTRKSMWKMHTSAGTQREYIEILVPIHYSTKPQPRVIVLIPLDWNPHYSSFLMKKCSYEWLICAANTVRWSVWLGRLTC